MADGYFLTESDLRVLKDVIAEVRRTTKRPQGRDPYGQPPEAPEVYVARTPVGGLPALTEQSGVGVVDTPGVAECEIFQLVDESGTVKVYPSGAADRKVYNILSMPVAANSWVVVVREKYGRWLAVPAGSGTGFHAQLTSGTGAGPWTAQPVTLNVSGGVINDPTAAAVTTAYAICRRSDGSPTPRVGARVWVIPSRQAGLYEFLSDPNLACNLKYTTGTDTYSVNVANLVGPRSVSGHIEIAGTGTSGCTAIGDDPVVTRTTTETWVSNVNISLAVSGTTITVTLDQLKADATNHFNLADFIVDRTAGSGVYESSVDSVQIPFDADLICECCEYDAPGVTATGPSSGSIGESLDFDATASGGRPPYTYQWDFDDGTSSTSEDPSHTFTAPGTYEVIVTVTDSCYRTATDSVTVVIADELLTDCCEEPIPSGLTAVVTGASNPAFNGSYGMDPPDPVAVSWGSGNADIGGCGSNDAVVLQCTAEGNWILFTDNGATGPFLASSVTCSPFSATFTGVSWSVCGGASGATVTISE